VRPRCELCNKQPSYGRVGGTAKDAVRCGDHRQPDDENLVGRACLVCNKRASFGMPGGTAKDAIFCVKHKQANHVNVINKTCMNPNCTKQPCYGPVAGKSEYCKDHRRPDDVNLVNTRCLDPTCSKFAMYGPKGVKVMYCASHRRPGDVSTVKKCSMCNKRPTFGPPCGISKDAVRCRDHREADDVDVCSRKCLKCQKKPTFGKVGGKARDAMYCKTHKRPCDVDVVARKCSMCDTKACYGPSGGKRKDAVFCLTHKSPEHVDLVNKKCTSCKKQPVFGLVGGRSLRCGDHKLVNDVNLHNKKCQVCTVTSARPRYKSHADNQDICARCFIYTYPDHKLTRVARIKERHVTDALRASLPDEIVKKMILDLPIPGGCSKRRPDVYVIHEVDGVLYCIIVECDENQHLRYDTTCENKRMMQLLLDGGEMPMLVIRFNPDGYTDSEGKRHTSCFGYDTHGLPRVAPKKRAEWDKRVETLLETVCAALKSPPTKMVDTKYLFYDDVHDIAE
jgi:hypothetical protein